MRSFLVVTGILVFAAHVHAQSAKPAKSAKSAPASTTTAPATTAATPDDTAPALIKTVVDDPNDSPMVRAAKRAVASRLRNPSQRRVVSLTTSSTTTRGRFAVSTGPAEGPKVPPMPSDAKPLKTPPVSTAQEAAAIQKAQVQEQLKRLETEQSRLAAEMDEPYGGDLEEDQVAKRMNEVEMEHQKLQQTTAPTPTPPPPPKP
jgi:hypothetical protein